MATQKLRKDQIEKLNTSDLTNDVPFIEKVNAGQGITVSGTAASPIINAIGVELPEKYSSTDKPTGAVGDTKTGLNKTNVKGIGTTNPLVNGDTVVFANGFQGTAINVGSTTYDAVLIYVPIEATWGTIEGTLSNQTDLKTALDAKQAKLTAGTNITIAGNNTISANFDSPVDDVKFGNTSLVDTNDIAQLEGVVASDERLDEEILGIRAELSSTRNALSTEIQTVENNLTEIIDTKAEEVKVNNNSYYSENGVVTLPVFGNFVDLDLTSQLDGVQESFTLPRTIKRTDFCMVFYGGQRLIENDNYEINLTTQRLTSLLDNPPDADGGRRLIVTVYDPTIVN